MSELIAAVIVPPYWGVPRLSHQFPVEVEVAVTAVVAAALVVDVVLEVDIVVEVVVTVVDVVVVVVVDELQDAKTSEITMRLVSATQIIPFFI